MNELAIGYAPMLFVVMLFVVGIYAVVILHD